VNADLDDLRSSGEAYAAALAAAGVDVTVVREVGVRHGHLNDVDDPGARRTVDRIIAWLRHDALLGEAHEPAPDHATASGVLTAAGSERA
jgi:acetyl esterase